MKQWEQGLFSCHRTVMTIVALVIGSIFFSMAPCNGESSSENINRKVIIFVWDGLRPDSISASTTPNLWDLGKNGVFFNKNHATYPTFTMMNSSSFNTGDFPDKVGFYGNTVYVPRAAGNNAAGKGRGLQSACFYRGLERPVDIKFVLQRRVVYG